ASKPSAACLVSIFSARATRFSGYPVSRLKLRPPAPGCGGSINNKNSRDSQEAAVATQTSSALSKNIELVSQAAQGGRPDGVQCMVHRGYAYIGHIFSNGVTVMDVRDPKHPKAVNFLPAFGHNWNIHLQTHEDLLMVVDEYNFYSNPAFAQEESYYGQSVEDSIKQAGGEQILGKRGVDYSAGMTIYDISRPDQPRKI